MGLEYLAVTQRLPDAPLIILNLAEAATQVQEMLI